MKKLLSLFVLAATVFPASAQILYRISGNGLQKDSYIVGTYHLADASFVDQIPGAREVLNSVEQVYGEVPMADAMMPDSVAVLQECMMLPKGQTLKDVLSEEQFAKLDTYFESAMGMKLSNPLVFGQMGKMSPASLENTLSLLKFLKKSGGQFNVQNGIDSYFQTEAIKMGKPAGGFESVYFQAHTLFDKPIADQVKALMCLIDNEAFNDLMADEVVKAYYAQDLDKINEVFNMKMGNSCNATPEEENTLVYDRNANWVSLMPSVMSEHSTLFAVGAAHLCGDRGVLALLKSKGYTITGVK